MSSIPTRRILSLAARPALRCSSNALVSSTAGFTSCAGAGSPGICLRAAFSRRGLVVAAIPRGTVNALRVAQYRRRDNSASVRWSTTSATWSKIWSFEEIKSLTTSTPEPKAATLIDVREPGELRTTGKIPGALNIPITTSPDAFHLTPEDFEDRFGFAQPGKDDEVVFYCKAGVRSRAAAGIAREAGWKVVGEYPGSWVEWAGKGGDVER